MNDKSDYDDDWEEDDLNENEYEGVPVCYGEYSSSTTLCEICPFSEDCKGVSNERKTLHHRRS